MDRHLYFSLYHISSIKRHWHNWGFFLLIIDSKRQDYQLWNRNQRIIFWQSPWKQRSVVGALLNEKSSAGISRLCQAQWNMQRISSAENVWKTNLTGFGLASNFCLKYNLNLWLTVGKTTYMTQLHGRLKTFVVSSEMRALTFPYGFSSQHITLDHK